jgi:Trehalase
MSYSPCCLERNWLNECSKFFHHTQLQAKPWTQKAWDDDRSHKTVWIVRDSLLREGSGCVDAINNVEVELLSLFGDEAHAAFRSLDSNRAQQWDKMNVWSELTCLITGTLFPLGPKKDGRGLMTCLARDWHKKTTKWTAEERAILEKLFVDNEWDILAFRTLITPFYLRRDLNSKWFGKWIIPRIRVRPKPEICDPQDHDFEQDLTRAFHNSSILKPGRDGLLNLNDIKVRADEVRKIAWSPIFQTLKRDPSQSDIEKEIMAKYPSTTETERIKVMKKKLQEVVANGQRYIICSSSVFLMSLAVYVRSSLVPF